MSVSNQNTAGARDPMIDTLVGGKYRIVGLLGRGGGGRVYKGVQEPLGRFVAIKVLGPLESEAWDPDMQVKRFLREATVTSKLTHPNTVVVHDYGALPDGGLYLVMEHLEGPTLRHVMTKEAPLAVGRAVRIARQIAGSLADAHEAGVVHRDLKPPNVMLVSRGGDREFVKVLDFGLVKSLMSSEEDVTRERSLLGSPQYMAPEQAVGEPVDQRSDIYSFGSTLYEMLCGQAPFRKAGGERNELTAVLRAVLTEPPPPFATVRPDRAIPQSLERLVMKCLGKRPEDRPSTMLEVLDALEAVAAELPIDESTSRRQPLVSVSSIHNAPAISLHTAPSVSLPLDAVTPSRVGPATLVAAPRRSWVAVAIAGGFAAAGLAALVVIAPWRKAATVSPPAAPVAAAPTPTPGAGLESPAGDHQGLTPENPPSKEPAAAVTAPPRVELAAVSAPGGVIAAEPVVILEPRRDAEESNPRWERRPGASASDVIAAPTVPALRPVKKPGVTKPKSPPGEKPPMDIKTER